MKFRVERESLADAVAWTAKSLPSRPAVPVLAGILLQVSDTQLTVSGFDYDVSSQVTLDVQAGSSGAALVSGRLLAEITKALPNKPVEMAAVGAHLELTCGSGRFTLPTLPVEDYPTLPSMPETAGTVDASTFAHAVSQVAIAAGRDDTIPMLTGIRLELAGTTLSLLATDRYRAAVGELTWRPSGQGLDIEALVPARTLADAAKTLAPPGGDVTMALSRGGLGEGMMGLSGGARRTTTRLLDPEFPNIRALFPDQHQTRARLNVAALTEVVKRVSLVADRSAPVRLAFTDGEVVIEAGTSEDARASEAMAADLSGDDITVAFNPGYFLDGLAALGTPTALLSFTSAMKPAVLHPADDNGEPSPQYRYLIMPMRATT